MTAKESDADDGLLFRSLMGNLPTAVTVVAAQTASGPAGLVVGTFTSVSLNPKLVGFMPTSHSRAWARLREAGRFTASILTSDQKEICRRLAGRWPDRFDAVELVPTSGDTVAIAGCLAWLECEVVAEHPAGDHSLVLASPGEMSLNRPQGRPLVFFRGKYHRTFQVEDVIAPGWA
jgi:3-hydroxy-9,10-secoandrosta-1,3,5(10)-triene-9,17-dione monooxygenase reductase component